MTITVTRSGGFLGAPTTVEVRTDALPPNDARRLEDLARALPDSQAAPAPGSADIYQYDVTVAGAAGSRSARFYGDPNPGSPLIGEVFRLRS
jgi:hypothetical protein